MQAKGQQQQQTTGEQGQQPGQSVGFADGPAKRFTYRQPHRLRRIDDREVVAGARCWYLLFDARPNDSLGILNRLASNFLLRMKWYAGEGCHVSEQACVDLSA